LLIIKNNHLLFLVVFSKEEAVLGEVEILQAIMLLKQINFVPAAIFPQILIMKMKLAQPLTLMSSTLLYPLKEEEEAVVGMNQLRISQ
jgi:hypothetical protein